MINLEALAPELPAIFVRQGWEAGMRMLCRLKLEQARRGLEDADPTDIAATARLQQEIKIYRNDLPSIERGVAEFLAAEATAKGKP